MCIEKMIDEMSDACYLEHYCFRHQLHSCSRGARFFALHYLSYVKSILRHSLSYDKLHRKTATPIFRSGRRFCYARLRRYSSTF